jgi:hypothetical protein
LTTSDIDDAIFKVSLDKAVSWDLIPGNIFKEFKKLKKSNTLVYNFLCSKLADSLNEMIATNHIPIDMATSRLVCLNKNGSERGRLDSIRPISVSSTVLKLLQSTIQNKLNEKIYTDGKYQGILNKKQIGFIKKGGCDLNILRLKAKAKLLLKKKEAGMSKSILFIDFKQAFDSVDHKILFEKLLKFGYSEELVNTIKFLYSNYRLKFSETNDSINVNRGVCQGDLMSPMLFNLYINDLIEELNSTCYDVLAYADDIAVICQSDSELHSAIQKIESWCKRNNFGINYKKSGILYLDSDFIEEKFFCGFPIVKEYKYLGVLIDSKLLVKKHINNVSDRIETYIQRNKKLLLKYFSPKSFLKIFSYFQKSRLVYGMSSFLDSSFCIKNLKSKYMKFVKSIFSLPFTTHHKKIKTTLGIPSIKTFLAGQLLKNVRKYEEIFNEEMTYFDATLSKYFPNEVLINLHNREAKVNFDQEINLMYDRSIKNTANKIGIEVSSYFIDTFTKLNIYNQYDRRNFFLIKFFCNAGFFRERLKTECKVCNMENSREHVTNNCTIFEEQRSVALSKLTKIVLKSENETFYNYLERIFFSPDVIDTKKLQNRFIAVMRNFIVEIFFTDRANFTKPDWFDDSEEDQKLLTKSDEDGCSESGTTTVSTNSHV